MATRFGVCTWPSDKNLITIIGDTLLPVMDVPRRKFLAALSALGGAVGLAGCGRLSNPAQRSPEDDTGTREQTEVVPPHDHASADTGGESIHPEAVAVSELSGPLTGGQPMTTLAGENLSIDDGELRVTADLESVREMDTMIGSFAPPGEVQSTIDERAESGGGTVYLQQNNRYRPDDTWHVRSDVTLNYNGATVSPSADVDVHLMYPRSRVIDPRVDLRDISFSSSVFLWDSARLSGYTERVGWPYVTGGLVTGTPGEGTLFYLHEGNETAIYFVRAQTNSEGMGTIIDMHRRDDFGINGCRFGGHHDYFEKVIHTRETGSSAEYRNNLSGNIFDLSVQSRDVTEMGWDMQAGHRNEWRGLIWDVQDYDTLWRLHEGAGGKNVIWRNKGTAGLESFIDDQVGDPTNSVFVPHQIGTPITDL